MMPLFKGARFGGRRVPVRRPAANTHGTERGRCLPPEHHARQPTVVQNLELSASIYNVTNATYSDPGSEEHRQDSIVQDGRNFRVRLTYHFRRGN